MLLIEHRRYRLRPGMLQAFWDAQALRGFDPARRTFGPLLGWFGNLGGASDEVTILTRFDGYDEWSSHLQSMYDLPELKAYFTAVRQLMLKQENKFLRPAPVEELTPVWGAGRDRLPGRDGPLLPAGTLLEETTLDVLPGQMEAYWAAWREHGLQAALARKNLLGCFATHSGPMNQVVQYRHFTDAGQWAAHDAALRADPAWRAFVKACAPFLTDAGTRVLKPPPHAALAPLLKPAT